MLTIPTHIHLYLVSGLFLQVSLQILRVSPHACYRTYPPGVSNQAEMYLPMHATGHTHLGFPTRLKL